jgi:two-component system nitrate/nitrite response regulator NarL
VGAIRVVVADDDEVMRSAVVDVLSADPRFDVVGTAASTDELVEAVGTGRPAVALVDVRMPGGGVAAATALTSLPRPPVVVAVSASTELTTVVAMMRAGASGYLGKGRLGESLPDLVARCAAGEVVLAVPNAVAVLRALSAPSA